MEDELHALKIIFMTNELTVDFLYCDFENPTHLQHLARLINIYIADAMGGGEPLTKLQQLRLVDGLANHPSSFVLFILAGDEVAGLATCFINFSTFKVKPFINLHDIVIEPAFKGKGLGRLLLQKVVEIATEKNCCKVTLEVREDNEVAKSLYQSEGFEPCKPDMLFWNKTI
jgi:ribosomal protein S18 acetylase RimI-like enzyme